VRPGSDARCRGLNAVRQEEDSGASAGRRGHDRRLRHEAVSDAVNGDSKPLERPDTEEDHVSRLREHHLIGGFEALSREDGVPDIASDRLPRGRLKRALPAAINAGGGKQIGRQLGERRSRIDDRTHGRCFAALVPGVSGNHADSEQAHRDRG
jgi:hypothetical protein